MIYYVITAYFLIGLLMTYLGKWEEYGLVFYWLAPIVLPIVLVWGFIKAIRKL